MADVTCDEMIAAGFLWDPTHSGLSRWTHCRLPITAIKQPFMSDARWHQELRSAMARSQSDRGPDFQPNSDDPERRGSQSDAREERAGSSNDGEVKP